MISATVVYNPFSGRYPSWLLVERAVKILENGGWDLQVEQTESGEQIGELARRAASEARDVFVVVGGDGSLNLALSSLIGTHTALAVLPAGTANVWAQELGMPGLSWTRWLALEESARILLQSDTKSIDVGMCNENPFLLWNGVGLDGFVVHHLEPRTRLEKHFAYVHYTATAVWNAGFWRGMNLNVEVEGQHISGHFLLALVSNIHLYAGGLSVLSPDALLDDGRMDLWLFKGETLADTVQLAIDLLSGRHLDSERVLRLPFQSLKLTSDSETFIQVDGEPVQGGCPVLVRVLPKALRVLVPPNPPRRLFRNHHENPSTF